MQAPELLDRAAGHLRDRAATYDKPEGERSMAQTVAIFNLHHGTALTEAQGWHMMQILKDVRLFTRPGFHADSAEDCTAYSALKAEAKAREVAPAADALGYGPEVHWHGGPRPVDALQLVQIRTRQEGVGVWSPAVPAVNFSWSHTPGQPDEADIVAFRTVK